MDFTNAVSGDVHRLVIQKKLFESFDSEVKGSSPSNWDLLALLCCQRSRFRLQLLSHLTSFFLKGFEPRTHRFDCRSTAVPDKSSRQNLIEILGEIFLWRERDFSFLLLRRKEGHSTQLTDSPEERGCWHFSFESSVGRRPRMIHGLY